MNQRELTVPSCTCPGLIATKSQESTGRCPCGHLLERLVFGSALLVPCLSSAPALAAGGEGTAPASQAELALPLANTLTVEATFARKAPDEPVDAHTFHTWSLGLVDTFTAVDGLTATAELHLDGGDLETFDVAPHLALTFAPEGAPTLTLDVARLERWPGGAGADTGACVALSAMSVLSLGLAEPLPGGATLAASAFARRLELGDDVAGATGADVGVEVPLGADTTLHVAYAIAHVSPASGEGPLPFVHATQQRAELAATWAHGPWVAKVSARYVGTVHLVQDRGVAQDHLAPAVLFDGYLARELAGGAELFVSLANGLDHAAEAYAWEPLFPRTVLAGLDLHLP